MRAGVTQKKRSSQILKYAQVRIVKKKLATSSCIMHKPARKKGELSHNPNQNITHQAPSQEEVHGLTWRNASPHKNTSNTVKECTHD